MNMQTDFSEMNSDGFNDDFERIAFNRQRAEVLCSAFLYDEDEEARAKVDADDYASVYSVPRMRGDESLHVLGRELALTVDVDLADMPMDLAERAIERVEDEGRRNGYRERFNQLGANGGDTAQDYYRLYAQVQRDNVQIPYRDAVAKTEERKAGLTGLFGELVAAGGLKAPEAWAKFYDGQAREVYTAEDKLSVEKAADAWGMMRGMVKEYADAGANVLAQASTGGLIMERLRGDELAEALFFKQLQTHIQDLKTSAEDRNFFIRFAQAFEAADKQLVAGMLGGHFKEFVTDAQVDDYNKELERAREISGLENPNVPFYAEGDNWAEKHLGLQNARLGAVHSAARQSGQLNEDGSLRKMTEEERRGTQELNAFRGKLFNATQGMYDIDGFAAKFGKMLPSSALYLVPGGVFASAASMYTQDLAQQLGKGESWTGASNRAVVNAAIQAGVEKIAFGSLKAGRMVPGMDWLMSRQFMARALGGVYGTTAGRIGMGASVGAAEETFVEPLAGLLLSGAYNAVASEELQLDDPVKEYRKEMAEMLAPDQLLATGVYGLLLGGVSYSGQKAAAMEYKDVRDHLIAIGVDEGRAAAVARIDDPVERSVAEQALVNERMKADSKGVLAYVAELYPQLQPLATVENYFDKGLLPRVLSAGDGQVKVQEKNEQGEVTETIMSESTARLLVESRLEELSAKEQAEMADMVLANAMVGSVSKDGQRWVVSLEDVKMDHAYFQRLARAAGLKLSEGARPGDIDPEVHAHIPLGQLAQQGKAWEQRMKVARHDYEEAKGKPVSDAEWARVSKRYVSRVNRTGVRGPGRRLRTVLRVARGGFGAMEVLEDVTEDNLVRDMEEHGRTLDYYISNLRELEGALGKPGAFLRKLKDGETEGDRRMAVIEAMGKLVQSKVLADTAKSGNKLSAALNAFLELIRSWVLQAKAMFKLSEAVNTVLTNPEAAAKMDKEFREDVERLVAQDVEFLQNIQLADGLEAMQRVYEAHDKAKADRKVKRRKRTKTPVLDAAEKKHGEEVRKEQAEKEKTQAEVQADVEAAEAAVEGDFTASVVNQEDLDAIKAVAEKDGTFMKAPNGKPTNLTEHQWLQVRTGAFKQWFGDWEKVARFNSAVQQLLSMSEVASITGTEFAPDGRKLTDKVTEFWNKEYGGVAKNPVLGDVVLDTRSVKASIAHGVGRLKSAAFAVVHDVIERGVLVEIAPDWKGRGEDSYVIAAPVQIGNTAYVCEVVVMKGETRTGFYLHEVQIKEKLLDVFKTGVVTGTSGASKSILLDVWQRVKQIEEICSKVVDENGEPLVVYHGSLQWFQIFNDGNERHQSGAPDGTIFANDNREIAVSFVDYYGGNAENVILNANDARHARMPWGVYRKGGIYPLFMNLKNPLVVDFEGMTWHGEKYDIKDVNWYAVEARKKGHDGLIIRNVIDVGFTDTNDVPPSTDYVAFESNQVKSVTDNRGTFDGSSGDITMSVNDAQEVGLFEDGVMEAANAIVVAPDASFSVTALHASPHKFRKFSTEKMGLGEGHQAFGWGLYFAESEDVNRVYYGRFSTYRESYVVDGKEMEGLEGYRRLYNEMRDILLAYGGDELYMNEMSFLLGQMSAGYSADELRKAKLHLHKKRKAYKDAYDIALSEMEERGIGVRRVDMPAVNYRVELNVDDSNLLMFDEVVPAELHEAVRALEGGRSEGLVIQMPEASKETWPGYRIYNELTRKLGSAKAASEWLAERGVKGIKYLDGGSRSAGEGSYNYVIFSGDDVKITGVNETGDYKAPWEEYEDVDASFSVVGPSAANWDKIKHRAFTGRDDGKLRVEIDASQAELKMKLKPEAERTSNVRLLHDKLRVYANGLAEYDKFKPVQRLWLLLQSRLTKGMRLSESEDWQRLKGFVCGDVEPVEFLGQIGLSEESSIDDIKAAYLKAESDLHETLSEFVAEENVSAEVFDAAFKVLLGGGNMALTPDDWEGKGETLGDILDYEELYAAYPEMRDIRMEYRSGGSSVRVSDTVLADAKIILGVNKTPEKLRGSLLHEIQHLIQLHEDFAFGGTPSNVGRIFGRLGRDAELTDRGDYDYKRLSGEIEARAVSRRQYMSEAERAGLPFNEAMEYPGEALTYRPSEFYATFDTTFSVSPTLGEDIARARKRAKNADGTISQDGEMSRNAEVALCTMPDFMRFLGEPDVPVVARVFTLRKLLTDHKLTDALTYEVVQKMNDPVLAIQETPSKLLLLLDMESENKIGNVTPVVAIIEHKQDKEGNRYLVSAYPLEDDKETNVTNQFNKLVYCKYSTTAKFTANAPQGRAYDLLRAAISGGHTQNVPCQEDVVKWKQQKSDFTSSVVNLDERALAYEVVAAGQGFRANLAFSEQIVREMRGAMQRMKKLGSKTRTEREDAIAAMGTMVQVVKAAVAYLPQGYRFSVHPYLNKLEVLAELATTGDLKMTRDMANKTIKEWLKLNQGIDDVVAVKGQELDRQTSAEDLAKEYGEMQLQEAMEAIMHRVAGQLRKHAKDMAVLKIKELVERLAPKKDPKTGKLKGGKMSADAYRDLEDVAKAMNMDAEELESKLAALRAEMEKPGLDEDKRAQLESEMTLYDQFGDLKSMTAEEAVEALEALRQRVWFHRFEWDNVQAERRAARRAMVRSVVDGVGDVGQNEYNAKKRAKKPTQRLKNLADILSGMPAVLTGLRGYLPLHKLTDDLARRANRAGEAIKKWEAERWVALEALSRETLGKSWRKSMDFMHEVLPTGVTFNRSKYRSVSVKTAALRELLAMTPEERRAEMNRRQKAGGLEAESVLTERDIEELEKQLLAMEEAGKVLSTVEARYVASVQREENLQLSRGEALYAILMWEQPTYTERMEAQGYTPEVIAGFKRFIGDGMLQFGYGLRELFARQGERIARVYEATFGVPFPRDENYFAARWNVTGMKENPAEQLLAGMAGTPGAGNGWMKQRVKHNLELDMTKDALQVFLQATTLTDTWMATQDIVADFKAWTRDPDFDRAMTSVLGKDDYENLKDWIRIVEQGGVQDCLNMGVAQDVINGLYASGAVAILGFRIQTLLRQLPSIFNGLLGAHDISAGEWLATLSRMKKAEAPMTYKRMMNSTLIQNRRQGKAGNMAGQAMRSNDTASSMSEGMLLASMLPMEWVDASCTAMSLVPVWNVYYQRAIDRGASVQEAEQAAWEQTTIVANLSAQPIGRLNKSKIAQSRNPLVKAVFYMLSENMAKFALCRALWRGGKKMAALRAWLIYGAANAMISALLDALQGDPEEFEKGELWEYLLSAIYGPLASIPGVGEAVEALGTLVLLKVPGHIFDIDELKKAKTHASVGRAMLDAQGFIKAWMKIYGYMTDDEEHSLAEYTRAASTISRTMAIGTGWMGNAVGYWSTVAAVLMNPIDFGARVWRNWKHYFD